MKVAGCLGSIALLVVPFALRAEPIYIDYSGKVAPYERETVHGYTAGTPVSGRLTIETDLLPADEYPHDPNLAAYGSSPLSSTFADFVLGYNDPHAAPSFDAVSVQNDRSDGDVYAAGDRQGYGTPAYRALTVQVTLPGLFDNDHVKQNFTVTRDQHPSYLLGVLEWGIGESYQALDVLFDRVTVTVGRCTS
jgi:hypothetical protein